MDILQQLEQIAQERDLPIEDLKRELESALITAYKKYSGAIGEVKVSLNPKKGWVASVEKEVVEEVYDPSNEITLEEAQRCRVNADIKAGFPSNQEIKLEDIVVVEVDPNRFGRIAAQTFKQVLSQKLREAEYKRIHDVFSEKIGEVISGTILRRDEGTFFIQINRTEAELPRREQVNGEHYRINERYKVYILKVDHERFGPRVVVSRTHPNLLKKLMAIEVPEIADGIVLLKGVAREPGQRSKVAVISTDERVDALGACVGQRGARIQAIMDELRNEKVDIVPYSEDPKTYIINALSPAKINSIHLNYDQKSAFVVVPDSQLSLAIGKGGQNVRLAAKLTDWKLDIRSESQAKSSVKPEE